MVAKQKQKQKKRSFPAIYRLVPLAKNPDADLSDAPLSEATEYVIRGSLQDYIIVSVPPTISYQAAAELSNSLMSHFDRSVLIVTHNVVFMQVERLSRKDAEVVVQRIDARAGSPNAQ